MKRGEQGKQILISELWVLTLGISNRRSTSPQGQGHILDKGRVEVYPSLPNLGLEFCLGFGLEVCQDENFNVFKKLAN